MLPNIRITKKRSRDNEEKTSEDQENVDNINSVSPRKDKECSELSKAANILTSLNSPLSSSQSMDSHIVASDKEINNNNSNDDDNSITVKLQSICDVNDNQSEEKGCDDNEACFTQGTCNRSGIATTSSSNSSIYSDNSDGEDVTSKKKRRMEINDNQRYQSPCAVFAKMHYDIADDDLDEYCKVHNLSLEGNKTRKIIRVLIHKERLAKQQRQFMQMNDPKMSNLQTPSIISEILNLFVRNADIIMEEYGMFPRTGNFQSQLMQCIALQEAGCSNRTNQSQQQFHQHQAHSTLNTTTLPQSPMASPMTTFQGYYCGVSPVNSTFSPRTYPPSYILQNMRRSSPVLSQAMLPPPLFSSKQMPQL